MKANLNGNTLREYLKKLRISKIILTSALLISFGVGLYYAYYHEPFGLLFLILAALIGYVGIENVCKQENKVKREIEHENNT